MTSNRIILMILILLFLTIFVMILVYNNRNEKFKYEPADCPAISPINPSCRVDSGYNNIRQPIITLKITNRTQYFFDITVLSNKVNAKSCYGSVDGIPTTVRQNYPIGYSFVAEVPKALKGVNVSIPFLMTNPALNLNFSIESPFMPVDQTDCDGPCVPLGFNSDFKLTQPFVDGVSLYFGNSNFCPPQMVVDKDNNKVTYNVYYGEIIIDSTP